MTEKCSCPNPDLCAALGRHVFGRLWDIWRGVNIDPVLAEQYRAAWMREATPGKKPVEGESLDCVYRGDEVREAGTDKTATRLCEQCNGSVRLKLYTCLCEHRHEEQVTIHLDCRSCDYREAPKKK